jgi:alkylation response protein AidB-like acyl-CoA dehydrogenase
VGEGFKIAMKTLDVFRMSVGAAAVGIGQAAFEAALNYSKKRVQFGSPIAKFQAIQLKLAEMATELDAARALVYRAAIAKDRGDSNVSRFASMAKFYATEIGFRAVSRQPVRRADLHALDRRFFSGVGIVLDDRALNDDGNCACAAGTNN